MYLVFLGPPGAGKGTQCQLLSKRLGIGQLSTGELLRKVQSRDREIILWAKEYQRSGALAPDHLMMRMVAERLRDTDFNSGCILDGFPRTVQQAELLDTHLEAGGTKLCGVVSLEVPEHRLIERLKVRAVEQGRDDDHDQMIAKRLQTFANQTRPLVEYYKGHVPLHIIDGDASVEAVFERISQAVGAD